MNDDQFGDLHAWIEPELEARLVALVLGEASAFETDELERLMEERPELRLFKRRLEKVHGLLCEAVKPKDDAEWRLSGERRAELFEKVGMEVDEEDEVVALSVGHGDQETRIRRQGLRVALMAAACLIISLLLAPFFMTGGMKGGRATATGFLEAERDSKGEEGQMILGEVVLPGARGVVIDREEKAPSAEPTYYSLNAAGGADLEQPGRTDSRTRSALDSLRTSLGAAEVSDPAASPQPSGEPRSRAERDGFVVENGRETAAPVTSVPAPKSVEPPIPESVAPTSRPEVEIAPTLALVDKEHLGDDQSLLLPKTDPGLEGHGETGDRFARERGREELADGQAWARPLAVVDGREKDGVEHVERDWRMGIRAGAERGQDGAFGLDDLAELSGEVAANETGWDTRLGTFTGARTGGREAETLERLAKGVDAGLAGGQRMGYAAGGAWDEQGDSEENADDIVWTDPGTTTIEVGGAVKEDREFLYQTEYEPPEVAKGVLPERGGRVPGLGAETAVGNIGTAGLRSGDAAVTRNSIDAILNNPDRNAEDWIETPDEGAPFASRGGVGTKSDDATWFNVGGVVDVEGNVKTQDRVIRRELPVRPGDHFGTVESEKDWKQSQPAEAGLAIEHQRKPATPSSSMAKVIASTTPFPTAVPVPEVDVPDPAVDFGSGDDFGDGWGSGGGGGAGGLLAESRGVLTNVRQGGLQRDLPAYLNNRLKSIVIPEIDFENTTVEEAVDFLRQRSRELDTTELDPERKGLNFVIRKARVGGGAADDALDADVGLGAGNTGSAAIRSLKLENVTVEEALQAIADQAGLKVEVGDYAVALSPASAGEGDEGEVSLQTQLAQVEGDLVQLRRSGSRRDNAVDRALESHDYVEAKREYENAQGMMQAMKLQHSSKRIGLRIPKSPVVVHENGKVDKKSGGFLGLGAPTYEGRTILQVLPTTPDLDAFGGQLGAPHAGQQMTRQFFATEFAVIEAEQTLKQAVEELDLEKKWKTDEEGAIRRLKELVSTEQVKGTDLIEIKVASKDKAEAKAISEKVAEAYAARRSALEKDRAMAAIESLDEELREQEDLVEEKRKVLDTIVQAIGIPYVEGVRGSEEGRSEEVLYALSERQLYEQAAERDGLENQIKTLTKLEDEELMKYAAGLNLPQNGVTELYGQYQESKRELAALQASGLGEEHPEVAVRRLNNEQLKQDLDKSVASLREILKTQMEMVDGRMERMRDTRNQRSDNSVDLALVEAKKEQLLAKIAAEEAKKKAAKPSVDLTGLVERLYEGGSAEEVVDSAAVTAANQRLRNIILPAVDFDSTTVEEAIEFLEQRSRELDVSGVDGGQRGVSFEIRRARVEGGAVDDVLDGDVGLGLSNPGSATIKELKLRNVPMATVLQYISDQAGMRYKIEADGKVVLLPASGAEGEDQQSRAWRVHPDIIKTLQEGDQLTAADDPFAVDEPDRDYGPRSLVDALKDRGLTFPEGASVTYLPESQTLVVKNSPTNLDLVNVLVESVGEEIALERLAQKQGEKEAKAEPFSTFSLHVSDVSFKLAQAALAKGEWPEAERVRVEEFVNAFDYGDPTPVQEEKVGCRMEQAAHPFMQQRNVLRIAMRTAAVGRAEGVPLRLTILLDNSGSMDRADRAQSVKNAFALLAGQLNPQDEVTLIGFARTPRLLRDGVSGDKAQELLRVLEETPSEGGTNLEEALLLGMEKAVEHRLEGAQNRIILLTDGAANLGDAEPERLAGLVERMRERGIAFDACGVGADGLNDDILEALTRKGDGRYYLLDRPEDADAGFAKQIAGALRPAAKNVKVQVEFNPKRVGHYALYGFEKHELKKEDFRNDSVDAAELAAEEAGVAMYHYEVLPNGEGDVGTVSVRFQDMATGEMVEKLWPIPYVVNPAPLEEAEPSMKLAATAALLGEALKGSAVGDLVEMGTLDRVSRSLQTVYPHNERVGQLIEMIGKVRAMGGGR